MRKVWKDLHPTVCEWVNTQKMYFLSRAQSSSHKTFKSLTAKDFKGANIDIGLGELTEGKTVSMYIFSLLRKLCNSTGVGNSCFRNYHRATEWIRLKTTTVNQLVQPSCSSRASHSTWQKTESGWFLSIPSEGDSTIFLGSLS